MSLFFDSGSEVCELRTTETINGIEMPETTSPLDTENCCLFGSMTQMGVFLIACESNTGYWWDINDQECTESVANLDAEGEVSNVDVNTVDASLCCTLGMDVADATIIPAIMHDLTDACA